MNACSLAAKYKELNYNFGLNENLVIDAMSVGNQTRYPNHGSNTANCVAISTSLMKSSSRIFRF